MKRLYQSVKEEHIEPVPGKVTGTVPDWLKGSLYKNGPGLFEVGKTKYNHYFDGMAVLQRFHITADQVTYQRRFLQSDTYKKNMAAKRIAVTEFATTAFPDPAKGAIARAVSFVTESAEETDNTNVIIFPVGDQLYTSSEASTLHRIDPKTLEVIDKVNLPELLKINQAAAHSHVDKSGTIHAIGYQFGGGPPKYSFFETPPFAESTGGYKEARVVASVVAQRAMHPSYFHSFGLTDNYYVFLEQPLMINVWKILAAKMKKHHMLECIEWDPAAANNQTRFRVIERSTGKEIGTTYPFVSEAFLALHHINTYEENGHLVVDVCGFHDGNIIRKLEMCRLTTDQAEEVLHSLPRPQPRRYVLPISTDLNIKADTNLVTLPGTQASAFLKNKHIVCSYEPLCQDAVELPRLNYEKVNGRPYKYFYGQGMEPAPGYEHTIYKVNVEERSSISWNKPGCYPTEAVFVERPGATEEDDGVVVLVVGVTDEGQDHFLLILDAKNLTELASVTFPGIWFPRDQHGIFVPDH